MLLLCSFLVLYFMMLISWLVGLWQCGYKMQWLKYQNVENILLKSIFILFLNKYICQILTSRKFAINE